MRKILAIAMLVGVLVIITGAVAVFAGGSKTVKTLGAEALVPNVKIYSNLRFSPGPVVIESGDTINWVHSDKTLAPHTVTIATPDQLVQSFDDFLGGCPECAAAAGAALAGHFPENQPPVMVLDPDADGQFSSPGDSLLFFDDQSISAQINAPAGSILYYFCAIHPWMQGTIEVK